MKITCCSLFLGFLLSTVLASEALSENELEFNLENPEHVKDKFIEAVKIGNVNVSKEYVDKYEYLTEKFNRDIFQGLIDCFDTTESAKQCWEIFELIKLSFGDLSQTTSTPLILAIRHDKTELVHALLKNEDIQRSVGAKDEFERTALMYAAKRGNRFVIQRIFQVSKDVYIKEFINAKDFFGKTAIHYACEMHPKKSSELPPILIDLKLELVSWLIANGAEIYADGPEYKLKSEDDRVRSMIENGNGKVVVEGGVQDVATDSGLSIIALKGVHVIRMYAIALKAAQMIRMYAPLKLITSKLVYILLANPLLSLLNEACFTIQQNLFPGVDMNLNISFDLGDRIQDFSFNILFVMMMVPVLMKIGEAMNRT